MSKLINWFYRQFSSSDPSQKKRSIKPLIFLGCLGLLLLIFSRWQTSAPPETKNSQAPVGIQTTAKKAADSNSIKSEEQQYDHQLEKILDQVMGVKNVSVMVTFDTTDQSIFEKNVKTTQNNTREIDQNGGKRQITNTDKDQEVVTIDNGSKKAPVIVGKKKAQIRGVLVVAKGADEPTVKAWIMEAVSTVLDIPTYKVQVLPKN